MSKTLFFMRDNFRPNVRLATNILMVVGTFLIAINLASVGKQDKKYIQRRDDCAEFRGDIISLNEFIKKYDLASSEDSKRRKIYSDDYYRLASDFCSFYRIGIN